MDKCEVRSDGPCYIYRTLAGQLLHHCSPCTRRLTGPRNYLPVVTTCWIYRVVALHVMSVESTDVSSQSLTCCQLFRPVVHFVTVTLVKLISARATRVRECPYQYNGCRQQITGVKFSRAWTLLRWSPAGISISIRLVGCNDSITLPSE